MIRVLLLKEDVFRPFIYSHTTSINLKQYCGCKVTHYGSVTHYNSDAEGVIEYCLLVDYYICAAPKEPGVVISYTHTLPVEALRAIGVVKNE